MIRPNPETLGQRERLPFPGVGGGQSVPASASNPPTKRHTDSTHLDQCLDRLVAGSRRLASMSIARRIELLTQCLEGLKSVAHQWVELACAAKGIGPASPCRAEEILAGPAATVRQLQLFLRSMRNLDRHGTTEAARSVRALPNGRLGTRVTPTAGLWDRVTFLGWNATTWLRPGITADNFAESIAPAYRHLDRTGVSLVLGAGNVSSIAASDMLTKLCVENRVVLLKMNPVNEYLGPVLERAFAPLIENDLIRVIYGDVRVGAAAVADARVSDIHITGSEQAFDAIVWGADPAEREQRRSQLAPQLTRPITSELGNVTPWIMVPGAYSLRQLQFQTANVVASLTNNSAFNCIATRAIITWKRWPERERFLTQLEAMLARVPQRKAYYPGAFDRFEQFAGLKPAAAQALLKTSPVGNERCGRTTSPCGASTFVGGTEPGDDTLPWTLIRNVSATENSPLLSRESFCPVCAEISLDADSPEQFLARATEFANERLWGTLAATITVPSDFRRYSPAALTDSIERLRYGSICLNQWSGLAFSLMSVPWGGHPDSTPQNIQSGLGWVHNSHMLSEIEKTVLDTPLTITPRPVWQPTHLRPEPLAWALLDLFLKPSFWNLNTLAYHGVRGGL